MKFFIDTANLEQIQEAYDLGVLDGVTTTPSLMAKEGIKGVENQRKHYVDICISCRATSARRLLPPIMKV